MEIIFWSSVALFIIAATAVAVMVTKHNRITKDEDPVPIDDMPARYEGIEYSEKPYYESFN
ncbi:MAG TPA: hypothetical protein VF008_09815 [Niastella sp.]